MRILVSNDDGYDAEGIDKLAAAMHQFGTVCVSAPKKNHSGASSSLTFNRHIEVHHQRPDFHIVDGTPVDCVHLALTVDGYLPWDEKPDLIVSGINSGGNLGDDAFYSGTIAAALEGVLLGIPAVAFSLAPTGDSQFPPTQFDAAAKIAAEFTRKLLGHEMPPRLLLSVNIPDLPYEQIKQPVAVRLGRRHPARNPVCEHTESDRQKFSYTMQSETIDNNAGTDFHAIEHGYVAVTPLLTDLTNLVHLEKVVIPWLT